MLLTIAGFIAVITKAQDNKRPVVVENSRSVFNRSFDTYKNYADQGNAIYINNSQFYNKDNFITNPFPRGNGEYTQPSNSNPINQNMNQQTPTPSGIIYSGYIPVREYGNINNRER